LTACGLATLRQLSTWNRDVLIRNTIFLCLVLGRIALTTNLLAIRLSRLVDLAVFAAPTGWNSLYGRDSKHQRDHYQHSGTKFGDR
jgi:hypothetical protein